MRERIETEFAPAKESIDWAEQAISEFNAAIQAFFQSNVAEVVTEIDRDTGENIRKIRLKQPLPKTLRRKATEALTNTKHAFDQAAFAARSLTSGRGSKLLYYPWSTGPADLARLLENRGIDKRLWTTFAAHEPYCRADTYSGGNDIVRALAKLANDKHTVGLAIEGHVQLASLGPTMSMSDGKLFGMSILRPTWNAGKNEAELMRWVGTCDVQTDYTLRFNVVFKETILSKSMDAPSCMASFVQQAKIVVESLQARCLELLS